MVIKKIPLRYCCLLYFKVRMGDSRTQFASGMLSQKTLSFRFPHCTSHSLTRKESPIAMGRCGSSRCGSSSRRSVVPGGGRVVHKTRAEGCGWGLQMAAFWGVLVWREEAKSLSYAGVPPGEMVGWRNRNGFFFEMVGREGPGRASKCVSKVSPRASCGQ